MSLRLATAGLPPCRCALLWHIAERGTGDLPFMHELADLGFKLGLLLPGHRIELAYYQELRFVGVKSDRPCIAAFLRARLMEMLCGCTGERELASLARAARQMPVWAWDEVPAAPVAALELDGLSDCGDNDAALDLLKLRAVDSASVSAQQADLAAEAVAEAILAAAPTDDEPAGDSLSEAVVDPAPAGRAPAPASAPVALMQPNRPLAGGKTGSKVKSTRSLRLRRPRR